MHGARGGAPVKHGMYTKEAKELQNWLRLLVAESDALTKSI
jgi:hypothetical protein